MMELLNKVLEIVSKWESGGQGAFLFGIFVSVCWLLDNLVYYFTVLWRGWPQKKHE